MIRILQLFSSRACFQTTRCVEQLSRQLGAGFEVEARTIGRGGAYRGLSAAVRALRNAAGWDVVHAWGVQALVAGALGWRGRLVFTPTLPMGPRDVRWLRAAMEHRDVRVVCPTATLMGALVSRGVLAERCEVVRPGVDFSRVRRRKDSALRAGLGLAEGDFVLLAAGESTQGARHVDAAWTGAILNELDKRYKVLLWGRGEDVGRVVRFCSRSAQGDMVRVAEWRLGRSVEFEELLGAADMIVVSAVGAVDVLPIVVSMGGGCRLCRR